MRTLGSPLDRAPPVGLTAVAPAAHGWRERPRTDRYSRRVAVLKRVLPTFGIALLLLVAAWPRLAPLLDSVRIAMPGIDLREARELKMLDPRYAGRDRYDRPYVVTAAVGRQIPNHHDLMSLEEPRAVLIAHLGDRIVLTARTGIYQSQAQRLDLFGDVTVTHQNSTRFVTHQAHANFSDNTARGDDPVSGHGPSGDISGQGFRVLDKGDTIIFTGRSHAVLNGNEPTRPASPPAALPPQIIRTAAALAAAAAALPAPSHSAALTRPNAGGHLAAAPRKPVPGAATTTVKTRRHNG
ncbi:MAG: LPS export ABC transporter periplasmic protein LptC [Stellaceae bacterium]